MRLCEELARDPDTGLARGLANCVKAWPVSIASFTPRSAGAHGRKGPHARLSPGGALLTGVVLRVRVAATGPVGWAPASSAGSVRAGSGPQVARHVLAGGLLGRAECRRHLLPGELSERHGAGRVLADAA